MGAENRKENADLDLGGGVYLVWIKHKDAKIGAIIGHPRSESRTGICEGSIWIKGSQVVKPDADEWGMTGTFENPTFSPSVRCHCGFHGWIREGKWVWD